jgi:hypothetical protein
MNKYGAIKTQVNGITFDSKAEARRYSQLLMLEKAGHIAGLTLQVSFELAKSVKFSGDKRAKPPLRYVADFMYSDIKLGKIVVEDVKGVATPLFKAKRHLMMALHGVEVRVVS